MNGSYLHGFARGRETSMRAAVESSAIIEKDYRRPYRAAGIHGPDATPGSTGEFACQPCGGAGELLDGCALMLDDVCVCEDCWPESEGLWEERDDLYDLADSWR